ncbi:MAG: nucleotidyltransferase domain-containing protein [Leptospiraceae bacterium]|nr:nucleotidyltransferase domain-containing protein [Leptospiraceae bacterium]
MNAENQIEFIKNVIIKNYHPEKLILFGSYSKNTFHKNSDIDILVISENEKQLPRYKRGLAVRMNLAKIDTPIDILFYTNQEIAKWKDSDFSFINTILKEGKVLYEQQK